MILAGPSPKTGTQDYRFDLTAELKALGLDGILHGGLTTLGSGQAVTGSITYRTTVLDAFSGAVPSKDASIDEGDKFSGTAHISAQVKHRAPSKAVFNVTDTSSSTLQLAVGSLATSVFAINGNPAAVGASVKAGDLVTYRITREVLSSDIEDLVIKNFFPMPIYKVANFNWAAGLAANTVSVAAGDTFHSRFNAQPTMSIDAKNNMLKLVYGDYDSTGNQSTTIDLLVTLKVLDQPFADGMFLANVVRSEQGSSNNGTFTLDAITSVKYTRPAMTIVKGVVGSSNPRATFTGNVSDQNVTHIDAGDVVSFQITADKTSLSSSSVYDLTLRDAIPAGFVIPASGLNLSVVDGTGKQLRYKALDGSGLFGAGIQLLDPVTSAGANRVVIRYDLQSNSEIQAGNSVQSIAEVLRFAALPAGANYATAGLSDSASVNFAMAGVEHSFLTTDHAFTTDNQVAIGEKVTYKVRVSVPELTQSNGSLLITLRRGLAVDQLLSISGSEALGLSSEKVSNLISNAQVGNLSANPSDQGRTLLIDFGKLVNSDRIDAQTEFVEVVYSAVVTNDAANNTGDQKDNLATWSYDNSLQVVDRSARVTVVEPKLVVSNSSSVTQVDAGDRVTITVKLSHDATSSAYAHDVNWLENIPAGTSYIPGSLKWVGGTKPLSLGDEAGNPVGFWSSLAIGAESEVQYDVIVGSAVSAGSTIEGQSSLTWSSLPGQASNLASSNTLSVERTGNVSDIGGVVNDYRTVFNSSLSIAPVQIAMELVGTSDESTLSNQLTIGERSTYRVSVKLPEGSHPLKLSVDQLLGDSTIRPESLRLIAIGSSVSVSDVTIGQTVDAKNGKVEWDLGRVTNSLSGDQITFELVAVVPNEANNNAGGTPAIASTVDYQHGKASASRSSVIVEPKLEVQQKFVQSEVGIGGTVHGVIHINHGAGSGSAAAVIDLSSLGDEGLELVSGSMTSTAGELSVDHSTGKATLRLKSSELAKGRTIDVNYQLRVTNLAKPSSTLTSKVSLPWQSTAGAEARSYLTQTSSSVVVEAGSVGGWVFVDANQDGIQQISDQPIYNVEVTLVGVDDLGNEVNRATRTSRTGRYDFSSVRPGSYTLIQSQPTDWQDGREWTGSVGGEVGSDQIKFTINGGASAQIDGYNFTESPSTYLDGTVFLDLNQDGILGQDETGIAGVEVTLVGVTHTGISVARKVVANSRGYYVFDELAPGTYDVTEGVTEGYYDAQDELGSNGGTKLNDAFKGIKVTVDNPGESYNFGEYQSASIRGQVYLDVDRDRTLDRKDGKLANVDVKLVGVNDLGEEIELSVTTDAHGSYVFDGLRPGLYDIFSEAVDELDFEIANVGRSIGAKGPSSAGVANEIGFSSIRLAAGARAIEYDLGHTDPNYHSSILSTTYEAGTIIAGSNLDDTFVVSVSSTAMVIAVNGNEFLLSADQKRSVRLLGSFGNDQLYFTGSENKEEIDLRRHSARVNGTWFETLVYGMEKINFRGGGNEDIARFYDSEGDDSFVASPMSATISGDNYENKVDEIHRIYAYGKLGNDRANLTGSADQQDNFVVSTRESKLYSDDFYLYVSGYDDVVGNATDGSDRAYLNGSEGDDLLEAEGRKNVLSGKGYRGTALGFNYTVIEAGNGNDSAALRGADSNDRLRSTPTENTLDVGSIRVIAKGFESTSANMGTGNDAVSVYDSNYDDTLTVSSEQASLVNGLGSITITAFEQLHAYMTVGGKDIANVYGSGSVDTFKAYPQKWEMKGSGYALYGAGFTQVNAYGAKEDIAYLYDSAYNDVLTMTSSYSNLSGQLYSNTVNKFGKVNAEAKSGDDKAVFLDGVDRSTVRVTDQKSTIFGTNFSHNVTGFDHLDVYYANLAGRDNVEFIGHIEYELLAADTNDANGKYKLRVAVADRPEINLKSSINNLKPQ